ncbi:MAG: transketolase [Phycisphaerales bacterium]|nr:MAG: transketolase [Phycisphaerales bacterium]
MDSLTKELERKSHHIRKAMLQMCIDAGKGHVTSCFSCVDILIALYYGNLLRCDPQNPEWPERDRFILSKGQASPALYTILADLGFYDKSELKKFNKPGGMFAVHLQKDVPGVEITAGSLGQGYGVAAGIALGARMNMELYNVYALLGDGECYEGSIWETAMFAAHNRLNNLITVVDRNYLCVTDFTENLVALEPFEDKWRSFGFNVLRVDGHSFEQLLRALEPLRSRTSDKPTVVIAETVKGQGAESLCHQPLWHGRAPSGQVADRCLAELDRRYQHV